MDVNNGPAQDGWPLGVGPRVVDRAMHLTWPKQWLSATIYELITFIILHRVVLSCVFAVHNFFFLSRLICLKKDLNQSSKKPNQPLNRQKVFGTVPWSAGSPSNSYTYCIIMQHYLLFVCLAVCFCCCFGCSLWHVLARKCLCVAMLQQCIVHCDSVHM